MSTVHLILQGKGKTQNIELGQKTSAHQNSLTEACSSFQLAQPDPQKQLINAIREYRKLADEPLALRGSEYAQAVQELNKAIDRAEKLIQN